MPHTLRRPLPLAGLALLTSSGAAAMTVTVVPSVQPPQPVGTMITFAATVPDAPTSNLWYRFRVRPERGEYGMIRDYGPLSSLNWTASMHEGGYELEVSARDLDTGDESTASLPFRFVSAVTSGQPVVSPTANSLVFLYSAPPCDQRSRMRVRFQALGGTAQNTPFQHCSSGLSMNFYLAGLLPATTYTAQHILDTGLGSESGPAITFTTGNPPSNLYSDTIVLPSPNPFSDPILLGGPLGGNIVANDLSGNVLWYGPADLTFLTRAEPGGEFWGIVESLQGAGPAQQVVRKFDLAGMTLLETNAARVNEQLTALGKRTITGFHHEARPIEGGRVAVLASVEQIVTDTQGPGPVDVLGDMIIVFDQNLNVVWTWDAFDNLSVNRPAVLGETCPSAGCPAFYLAPKANDWTHGNALQETADGNILFSIRNQDWLVKISYDHGNGDGHILWRMGVGGDFQINSSDPYPWFSHQHDGNFAGSDPTRLLVFDDGNTRVAAMRGGNSRGQVFQIDEQNFIVNPILNADLGVYSEAVGSAQLLLDGNYHFDAGFVPENNTIDSYSIEVDPAGHMQYEAHQNVILYRTFRMTDLYTPD